MALTRRDFLRALGVAGGAAAVGAVVPQIILVAEEPIRRYWQVPAGAPMAHRDPNKALIESAIRTHVMPQWRELSDREVEAVRLALASTSMLARGYTGDERTAKEMDAADERIPLTAGQTLNLAVGIRSGDVEMKPLTLGRNGSWLCFGGFGKLELHIAPHLARDMKRDDLVIGGPGGVSEAFDHLRRRSMDPHAEDLNQRLVYT